MQTRVEKITPEMARNFLETNLETNRNLSTRRVERYARDMREGRWQLTHQGIAFDSKGYLVDGQHRLTALVQAGVTLEMSVTVGVPSESFTVVDQNFGRTIASFMQGRDTSIRAALLRAACITVKADYKITATTVSGGSRVTPQEVVAFGEENEDIANYARNYAPIARRYGVRFGQTTGAGLLFGGWVAGEVDIDGGEADMAKRDEWWRDVVDFCEATRVIQPGHPLRVLAPGDVTRHSSGVAYMNAAYAAFKFSKGESAGRIAWRMYNNQVLDIKS